MQNGFGGYRTRLCPATTLTSARLECKISVIHNIPVLLLRMPVLPPTLMIYVPRSRRDYPGLLVYSTPFWNISRDF